MASRAEDAPAPLPPSRRRYCRPNTAAASAASPRLLACQIPPPPPDLTAARLCVAAAAAARAAPFGALVQRFRLAGGPRPRFPVTPRPHFSHGRPAVMHDRAARCGTPAKRARQSGFCHAGANAAGNRCEFMPRRNRRRFVRSRVPSARRAAVQRLFPARSLLAQTGLTESAAEDTSSPSLPGRRRRPAAPVHSFAIKDVPAPLLSICRRPFHRAAPGRA